MKISKNMLKVLHENGIKVSDYLHLDLLDDYERMKGEGEKTSYIVAVLAEKYKMCERKVYKVLRKMCCDCIL